MRTVIPGKPCGSSAAARLRNGSAASGAAFNTSRRERPGIGRSATFLVGWVERSEAHRAKANRCAVGLATLDPPYETLEPLPLRRRLEARQLVVRRQVQRRAVVAEGAVGRLVV